MSPHPKGSWALKLIGQAATHGLYGGYHVCTGRGAYTGEREFLIDNPPVRIHYIIVMINRTGFEPWDFESPTFLGRTRDSFDPVGPRTPLWGYNPE